MLIVEIIGSSSSGSILVKMNTVPREGENVVLENATCVTVRSVYHFVKTRNNFRDIQLRIEETLPQ